MNLFGFTPQEYNVIKELMQVAKEIYVTVCTDDINEENTKNEDTDIFYSNKVTLNKLTEIAKLNNIEIRKNYIFR